MAAAEQARELLAQPHVDALEGVLEARACLLVDAPHRLGQRVERGGEVGELTVEVFLALRLLAQLVDGGEVHRPEPLDVGARLGEDYFPGGDIRLGAQPGEHHGELAAGGDELLGERGAAHVGLLRGEARLLHRFARSLHPLLGAEALFVERRAARRRPPRAHGAPRRARLPP